MVHFETRGEDFASLEYIDLSGNRFMEVADILGLSQFPRLCKGMVDLRSNPFLEEIFANLRKRLKKDEKDTLQNFISIRDTPYFKKMEKKKMEMKKSKQFSEPQKFRKNIGCKL